jgi:PAS domain S-box-containing protein
VILRRFPDEEKTLSNSDIEVTDLDQSAIIEVYEKLYDQFVDVKRLTFSMAGMHRKPDAVAALISKEISNMVGVKSNAVWLLTGAHRMVEMARDGKPIPVDERRTIEWNSSSEVRDQVLNQRVIWGPFHGEMKALFPHFESPIVFPIKGSTKALGFLILDQGAQLDAEGCQHIAGFSALILEMSDLYFRLKDEIKERQSLEALLIKERDRAQKYLDVAEVILLALDELGRVELINRKGCQILGYPLEEIIGKDWFECFVVNGDRQFLKSVFVDVLTSGSESSMYVESGLVARNGDQRIIAWRNTRVTNDEGRAVGTFSSGEDITERKRVEREKQRLQAHLFHAQKMEAIGTLVGGIAHDFNNMLQIIIGYSDLILMDTKKTDPVYSDIQSIIRTSKEGAELVRRLLLFGQESSISKEPLDLNHLIKQLNLIMSHTLPKAAQVELNPTNEPVLIHGDRNQIEQTVMNLVINSSEAMPEGGRIKIQVKNVVLDDDHCRSFYGVKPGKYAELLIADTGKGMDRPTLDKIFEPFFSTKDRGSIRGTGLGLSVVQGIVESHGGHIKVESQPGKGTEFRIYLPAIEFKSTTTAMING